MLNERFYESSESTAHYFPTHLLSDYFLLSAYFLAVSCYKCMRLTTSAYGNSVNSVFTRIGLEFVLRHPGGVDLTKTFFVKYTLKSWALYTASPWKWQSVCFRLPYDEKRSVIEFLSY